MLRVANFSFIEFEKKIMFKLYPLFEKWKGGGGWEIADDKIIYCIFFSG